MLFHGQFGVEKNTEITDDGRWLERLRADRPWTITGSARLKLWARWWADDPGAPWRIALLHSQCTAESCYVVLCRQSASNCDDVEAFISETSYHIVADRVSGTDNAIIGPVRPSVRPSVPLSIRSCPLYLLNRLTFDGWPWFLRVYGYASWP